MIKLSERERQLVFIFVVLLMFALTFKFGYLNITEKAANVETENIVLREQLGRLNLLISKEQELKDSTEDFKKQTADIVKQYGPRNTPEKTIIFLNDVEIQSGLKIDTISFGEMYSVAVNQEEEGEENAMQPVGDTFLYCTPVTVSYTGSYAQLKKAIGIVNGCVERMTVDSFTASYSMGTGKLAGSFSINMYEATGTDKIYRPPVITDIPIGNPLPFGVN